MVTLIDHHLPLIRLKEMRRDLVLALGRNKNGIDPVKLLEIASVQQAIAAAEEVIADIDAELERDSERGDDRTNFRQYA
jgi:hypothetical protein